MNEGVRRTAFFVAQGDIVHPLDSWPDHWVEYLQILYGYIVFFINFRLQVIELHVLDCVISVLPSGSDDLPFTDGISKMTTKAEILMRYRVAVAMFEARRTQAVRKYRHVILRSQWAVHLDSLGGTSFETLLQSQATKPVRLLHHWKVFCAAIPSNRQRDDCLQGLHLSILDMGMVFLRRLYRRFPAHCRM